MRTAFYFDLPAAAFGERAVPEDFGVMAFLVGLITMSSPLVLKVQSQLHPLVPPQVLHFMQVPFRTSV
jgi:hypothetical protein